MFLSQLSSSYKYTPRWCIGRKFFHSRTIIGKHRKKDIHPKKPAITRFAPSPTGLLHVGSLRTALYNFLLARNTGGRFILRLEDTDKKRCYEQAESNIVDTLNWCGIHWDGSIFKQSLRTEEGLYATYVKELLEKGVAYKCFCSKERLTSLRYDGYDRHCQKLTEAELNKLEYQEKKPYTVRLKMDKRANYVHDLLHGKVLIIERKDRRGFDDPVLLKSDGYPTYHLANVIDDHLMGITHVIRGDEWLSSTPKHLALYEAFGWNPPKYIHIPLLTNLANDKKLSKRHGDLSVLELKNSGILPEALINFVALLGWSPPRDISKKTHECFTLEQLIEMFSLNHLTKGNIKVDDKKLKFFNKHFLHKKINSKEINSLIQTLMIECKTKFDPEKISEDLIREILLKCGSFLDNITEFTQTFEYFFQSPAYIEINDSFVTEANKESIIKLIRYVREYLNTSNDIHQIMKDVIADQNEWKCLDKQTIYKSIRYALTGLISGTKLPIIIDILGLKETQKRLQNFEHYLQNRLN